ncbi:unannotated protein [freshwater metagenome]|uniref:Unannotated protein n=1 Tax=freshwater metagenome TaxID=449393 RepID=A0A6J7VHM4_9ZZZZ
MTLVELETKVLLDEVLLGEHVLLECREIGMATLVVNPSNKVGGEVDDLFELLGLDLFTSFRAHEEVREP